MLRMKQSSVSVVAPIYNDMHSMPRILPGLVATLSRSFVAWEIVLIDDASTDGSREWAVSYAAKNKHIRLFTHKKNLGIAQTYRELYAHAGKTITVLFSLDGGWDYRDVLHLARALEDDGYDMVIGVRKRKCYTIWRAVVSAFYNESTRLLFGVATRDAGSIKAIRTPLLRKILIISSGVFDEAERIIRAKHMGYRIGYIPVSHARAAMKKRTGVRIEQVIEALGDMVRVRISI